MKDYIAVLNRRKQRRDPQYPLISSGSIVDRIRVVLKIMIVIEGIGMLCAAATLLLLFAKCYTCHY